jgi:Putative zinc-finger
MSGPTCRGVRLALGIYVVGAIDPAERAIVEEHLSHCPECREELAGLAGLPALLGRVPVSDAERLALDSVELKDLEEPPARVLSSLLDEVALRRKTRRWRVITAAAAAAVIAVGGGLAGGVAVSNALGQHGTSNGQVLGGPDIASGANAKTHVTAEVSYSPAPAGTTLTVWVNGVRAGTVCHIWILDSDGERSPAGHWITTGYKSTGYRAWSSVAAASVHGFQIIANGKLLVYIPAS